MSHHLKTTLEVAGMTCGSCVRHIQGALGTLAGVNKVEVSLRDGRVTIWHDDNVSTKALIEMLEMAGYESHLASSSNVMKEERRAF